MTRIDLHPEDLLDRAARGVITFADSTRLKQHLAECAVCRVERALFVQAAIDAAPLRDEPLVVARLTRDVSARLASPTARRARRKSALVASALVAVCVAGAAAAATLAFVRRAPVVEVAPSAAPPVVSAVVPVVVEERAVELVAPSVEAQPGEVAPQPARPGASPTMDPLSASELFGRANQARRDGKVAEAARLYRSLQERFAGSSEELVSRVSLGRLLLDRLGDSRGALVQFNSYLASPAGGALREEAMVGRALALGRLGRAAEERGAWQALLDSWPKSTHRKRAQARLVELGGAASGTADATTRKSAGGRAQ